MARGDIAISERSLGFNSQAGQIVSSVTNDSPPPQCFLGGVLPRRQVVEMELPLLLTRFGLTPPV